MKPLPTAGVPGDRFQNPSMPTPEDRAVKALCIKKYTSLLHQIASSFGFSDSEARELVGQVSAYALKHPAADCYPFRIWLSKIMVHLCTFRIGRALCAQAGPVCEGGSPGPLADDYRSPKTREQHLQAMPLSFRTVYLLHHDLGFTTPELALILNTTPPAVTERYTKALALLARQYLPHWSA